MHPGTTTKVQDESSAFWCLRTENAVMYFIRENEQISSKFRSFNEGQARVFRMVVKGEKEAKLREE
jgi:hypothetical protein